MSQKCWSLLLELIVGIKKLFELQCWSWLLELHVGVVVLGLESCSWKVGVADARVLVFDTLTSRC